MHIQVYEQSDKTGNKQVIIDDCDVFFRIRMLEGDSIKFHVSNYISHRLATCEKPEKADDVYVDVIEKLNFCQQKYQSLEGAKLFFQSCKGCLEMRSLETELDTDYGKANLNMGTFPRSAASKFIDGLGKGTDLQKVLDHFRGTKTPVTEIEDLRQSTDLEDYRERARNLLVTHIQRELQRRVDDIIVNS